MEGSSDPQKADSSWRNVQWMNRELTEVPCAHGKLMEVDGKSSEHMES